MTIERYTTDPDIARQYVHRETSRTYLTLPDARRAIYEDWKRAHPLPRIDAQEGVVADHE